VQRRAADPEKSSIYPSNFRGKQTLKYVRQKLALSRILPVRDTRGEGQLSQVRAKTIESASGWQRSTEGSGNRLEVGQSKELGAAPPQEPLVMDVGPWMNGGKCGN